MALQGRCRPASCGGVVVVVGDVVVNVVVFVVDVGVVTFAYMVRTCGRRSQQASKQRQSKDSKQAKTEQRQQLNFQLHCALAIL